MANTFQPAKKDQLQQQQLVHHQVHLNTISTLTTLYQATDKTSEFAKIVEAALSNLVSAFLPATAYTATSNNPLITPVNE